MCPRSLYDPEYNPTPEGSAILKDFEAKVAPLVEEALNSGVDAMQLHGGLVAAITWITGEAVKKLKARPARQVGFQTQPVSRSVAPETTTLHPQSSASPVTGPDAQILQWLKERGWTWVPVLAGDRTKMEFLSPDKEVLIAVPTTPGGLPQLDEAFHATVGEWAVEQNHRQAQAQGAAPPPATEPQSPTHPRGTLHRSVLELDRTLVSWARSQGWYHETRNVSGHRTTEIRTPPTLKQSRYWSLPAFADTQQPYLTAEIRMLMLAHQFMVQGQNLKLDPVAEKQDLILWAVGAGWVWELHNDGAGGGIHAIFKAPKNSVSYRLPWNGIHPTLSDNAINLLRESRVQLERAQELEAQQRETARHAAQTQETARIPEAEVVPEATAETAAGTLTETAAGCA